jgi:A/G-specific adenine glycosylase
MKACGPASTAESDNDGWYAFPMAPASYGKEFAASASTHSGPLLARSADLHAAILSWYVHHRRDLPWRKTRDPYRILVSEIMLQQTQVDRVIPKYEEFLKRFPSIADLAKAPLSDVLRVWSPLGYNRRARYLHLAARAAWERFGGELPSSVTDLRSLPGLGRYTAGAVACFAFELRTPVVDTNVRRVLGRALHGHRYGLSDSQAWRTAEAALPAEDAYTWNQALMDLGATICGSEAPKCDACPVAKLCLWRSQFGAESISFRRVREPRSEYRAAADPGAVRRRWRGRIVEALRAVDHDDFVDWQSVMASLPGGYDTDGVDLIALLSSLVEDGLVESEDSDCTLRVRLPR